MDGTKGLHHITAVAGDPQKNVDFYHALLGQRLVKTTVNFDDPGTYHFYFGDEIGSPGTILTFFPWRGMPKGVRGNGEVAAIAYTISPASVQFWRDRLTSTGLDVVEEDRFRNTVLVFEDPDGMTLELISDNVDRPVQHWKDGPILAEHALRGFHGVTLWVENAQKTAELLTGVLGYALVEKAENRYRYQAQSETTGVYVDLLEKPGLPYARLGAGSVHHVAFRTVDDDEQIAFQQSIAQAGLRVTSVQDRQYFRSIYFREPGGVLFEIATDEPGFLYDESVESLGTALKLPPWLESNRQQIAQSLPSFSIPTFETEESHDR